jgi:hypothetical protein
MANENTPVKTAVNTTKNDIVPSFNEDLMNDVLLTIGDRFVNPSPSNQQTGGFVEGTWFHFTAIPIYKLSNNVRAPAAISNKLSLNQTNGINTAMSTVIKGDKGYKFSFLAPNELMETISHSWEPYESVASNLAGLYTTFGISIPAQTAGALKGAGFNSVNALISDIGTKFKNAGKIAKDLTFASAAQFALGKLSDMSKAGDVANFRVDTPLQYKGSERRSWELIFNLINTEQGQNWNNVVLPTKLLQSMSTPSYSERNNTANSDIILPYLFKIETTPNNIIFSNLSVLKSVNPTWKGPWIDGYPSRCELRLSFTEYKPLDSKVFFGASNEQGIIQTYIKSHVTSYDQMDKVVPTINDGKNIKNPPKKDKGKQTTSTKKTG